MTAAAAGGRPDTLARLTAQASANMGIELSRAPDGGFVLRGAGMPAEGRHVERMADAAQELVKASRRADRRPE